LYQGNQRVYYNLNGFRLLVAYPLEHQAFIANVFNDRQRGYGVGLTAFYQQVAMSYLGITKQETDLYLKSKGNYQIAVVPIRKVNRPVVAKGPNIRWNIDIINMEAFPSPQNANRRFILTVVDSFSGKVFARGLTTNRNNIGTRNISNALNNIVINDAGGQHPRIIQSDQEFGKGYLLTWYAAHNIKHVQTPSYTPTSNGKVERANRSLRRKIKAGCIRTNVSFGIAIYRTMLRI